MCKKICGARWVFFVLLLAVILWGGTAKAFAQGTVPIPSVNINLNGTDDPAQMTTTLQLLFFLSIITLAPSLLIMLTSFTRIIISLHFMRSALGTQQMPPNQVLIGLALFLTLFVMTPVLTNINDNAIKPFSDGTLTAQQALDKGMTPLREFMRNQSEEKDIALFLELADEKIDAQDQIPDRVLIPAFMLGELTKGFKIGFVMYLPFIVIDMVVASVLMAMGMMMLPPAMISMPFKILLFIMGGGWSFMIETIMRTFR